MALYGPDGRLLFEYDGGNSFGCRIYFGGTLLGVESVNIAGSTPIATPTSTLTDRLGSGTKTYPYGTDIGNPVYSDLLPSFATYTRNSAQGLLADDLLYANQRWYSSALGRFTTADPSNLNVNLLSSMSWNRYAYANGDPVGQNDPLGSDGEDGGDQCGPNAIGCMMAPQPNYTLSQMFQNDPVIATATVTGNAVMDAISYVQNNAWFQLGAGVLGAAVDLASAFEGNGGATGMAANDLQKVGVAEAEIEQGMAGVASSIESGLATISQNAATGIDHIVLGLQAQGLEETATQVGGRTLMTDLNWQTTLQTSLGNPSTRLTVSLDGVNGTSPYSQFMSAAQQGLSTGATPFNWEMGQLYQAGRHGDVTFMQGGQVVSNPFH